MANIMTKRGNLDNIVTYEHICDTVADMQNIDPRTATLGSVCIVIKGENDSLEVYIADSNREWNMLSTNSGGSGSDVGVGIHICGNNEYDSTTGQPIVEDPIENQFYLVPSSGSDSSNLFDEWIYINEKWEKFGGGSIDVPEQTQVDWSVKDSTAIDYIKNKPPIKEGTGDNSIIVNAILGYEYSRNTASGDYSFAEGFHADALGAYAHAEGFYTIASGDNSHAEGNGTIANKSTQHVFGSYNIPDPSEADSYKGNYVEIVGNGENLTNRSNARTLDWNGNQWLAGNLTLNQTTLTENKLQYLVDLNVDNTLDIDKPVSTAQRAAIDAVATKSVEVTGTDVIITAVSNTRYICGELSTLDFTPSVTGISDVIFTSGSSKTILTLPSTVKMPDWFEVETNMTYEISIADGVYGVVTSWAV